jgi:predicted PurR-regulated permease PerM
MERISNNVIRQVLLILLIVLTGIVILFNLKYFIPGVLGAITLYILFRDVFFRLTEKRKWNKSLASILLMIISLVLIAGSVWILVEVLIPQFKSIVNNKQIIIEKFDSLKAFMESKPLLNRINLSEENLMNQLQKVTTYIPGILNSIAEIFVNVVTAFFILYFMQVNARTMERRVRIFMPMSNENARNLWTETDLMVRANALGIPLMALAQGILAWLGYWFLGVNNPLMWGLITGAATIVPAVGTMIVWVPICIVQFATGHTAAAIALTIYCLVIVGGADNVLRFTILKRIGDVHPLITVFGVLLGLKLFGIMGLIFGPLLLSYFGLLLKIYRTEFGKRPPLPEEVEIPPPPEPGEKAICANPEG